MLSSEFYVEFDKSAYKGKPDDFFKIQRSPSDLSFDFLKGTDKKSGKPVLVKDNTGDDIRYIPLQAKILQDMKGCAGVPQLITSGQYTIGDQRLGEYHCWIAESDPPGQQLHDINMDRTDMVTKMGVVKSLSEFIADFWKHGYFHIRHSPFHLKWDGKKNQIYEYNFDGTGILHKYPSDLALAQKTARFADKVAAVVPHTEDEIKHLVNGYKTLFQYGIKTNDSYVSSVDRDVIKKEQRDQSFASWTKREKLIDQAIIELKAALGKPDCTFADLEQTKSDDINPEKQLVAGVLIQLTHNKESRRLYAANELLRANAIKDLRKAGIGNKIPVSEYNTKNEIDARIPDKLKSVRAAIPALIENLTSVSRQNQLDLPPQIIQQLRQLESSKPAATANPLAEVNTAHKLAQKAASAMNRWEESTKREAAEKMAEEKRNDLYSFLEAVVGIVFRITPTNLTGVIRKSHVQRELLKTIPGNTHLHKVIRDFDQIIGTAEGPDKILRQISEASSVDLETYRAILEKERSFAYRLTHLRKKGDGNDPASTI